MSKINDIATGWKNVILSNKEIKALAAERMSVCNECPEKMHIANMCKMCGCPLVAKTRSPKSTCPLKKWPK